MARQGARGIEELRHQDGGFENSIVQKISSWNIAAQSGDELQHMYGRLFTAIGQSYESALAEAFLAVVRGPDEVAEFGQDIRQALMGFGVVGGRAKGQLVMFPSLF